MLILGLSSASDILEVCLYDEGKVISEHSSMDDLRAEKLAGHIDLILKYSGKDINDVGAIALTIGPGSYGGLRGGLATAKALSQSRDIPLIGVSTLEAIAKNFEGMEGLILVTLHACKEEYNAALFASANGIVKRLTDDFVVTLDVIAKKLSMVKGRITLACPRPDIFLRIKELDHGSEIIEAGGGMSVPRASKVAIIGARKFTCGETIDPLESVPHYSHDPNIREFK